MAQLTGLKGVGPALASALAEHGITSAEKLAAATAQDLTAVPGIGQARARMLIAAAGALVQSEAPPPTASGSKKPKAKKDPGKKGKSGKKKKKKASKTKGAKAERSKKSEKRKSVRKGDKDKKDKAKKASKKKKKSGKTSKKSKKK